MTAIARKNSYFSACIGPIGGATNKLLINIERNSVAPGDDRQEVGLAEIGLNSGAFIVKDGCVVLIVSGNQEGIGAIMADAENVKLIGDIIGAKNQSTLIAFKDGHLHLQGEVAKIRSVRETGDVVVFLKNTGVQSCASKAAAPTADSIVGIPV